MIKAVNSAMSVSQHVSRAIVAGAGGLIIADALEPTACEEYAEVTAWFEPGRRSRTGRRHAILYLCL